MNKTISFLICFIFIASLSAQMKPEETEYYHPQPPRVTPGNKPGNPSSDAIVLFDGKDLHMWRAEKGGEAQWTIRDGSMVVKPGTGSIVTKKHFGNVQLHIEFKSPLPGKHNGQNRGNSGIFLQSLYEIQVLDADNNPTYVNGMVGSVYKQQPPLANAYTKNGEWQIYDIYWKAPVFETEGKLETPAMITVVLNGILVQNNYILKGNTPYQGYPQYKTHGLLPLLLQDHGTEVEYRNIWIREL